MTLHTQLYCIILKYLKPLDFETLEKIPNIITLYSRYDNVPYIMKHKIIYNIHKRLKYLLDDKYEKFMYYMKKSNAALSGSFILQCILDEYWNDSDIDIYLYCDCKIGIKYRYIYHHDNRGGLCRNSYITNYLYTHFQYMNSEIINDKYPAEHLDIGRIENFMNINKKMIQVINVENNVFEVVNNFDLNMLKNIYYFDENGDENIYIANIDDIKNRKIAINKERDVHDIDEYWKEALRSRIEKYKKRGFTLQS